MAPRPLNRWASQRTAADNVNEAEEEAASGASAGHVEGDKDSEKDEKKNSEENGEEEGEEDAKENDKKDGEEDGDEQVEGEHATEGATNRDQPPASHTPAGFALSPQGGFRQTPYSNNEDLGSLLQASRPGIYAGTNFTAQDPSSLPPTLERTHDSADDADDEREERPRKRAKKHRFDR